MSDDVIVQVSEVARRPFVHIMKTKLFYSFMTGLVYVFFVLILAYCALFVICMFFSYVSKNPLQFLRICFVLGFFFVFLENLNKQSSMKKHEKRQLNDL